MAEALAAAGCHPWLDMFAADPDGELDRLLRGLRQVPPYYRADPGDVLTLLITSSGDDPLRAALDRVLNAWLAARRREPPERRTAYGVSRFVGELTEALSLVYRLRLPETARTLFDEFGFYDSWLESLDLGPGYRPHREFLRAVAEGQRNRRLRAVWLDLCAAAAEEDDVDDRLDIALIGLKKLPGNDKDAGREMLTGLAAFGRALPTDQHRKNTSRRRFLGRWRAVKGLYPRTPAYWRDLLGLILKADEGQDFAEWWRGEERLKDQGSKGPQRVSLPPREDRERIIAAISLTDIGALRDQILSLMEKYRRYAEATGDSYNLVRSASTLASELIAHDPSLSLHLVGIGREWAPNHEHLWTIWGRALAALGHADLAELVLWEATRRFPDNEVSRNALAGLLHDLGRSAEAEALYRETTRRFPDDEVARNALGLLLIDLGRLRLREAEELLAELKRMGAQRQVAELGAALARARAGEAVVRPAPQKGAAAAERDPGEVVPSGQDRRSARLTRADFRLSPALDMVGRDEAAPLRDEAWAMVAAALADDPNEPYARLIQLDRLPEFGQLGEALLDALPHDYPLHLSRALRDPERFHGLDAEFAEHRPLTRLGRIATGTAAGEHLVQAANWLARPAAPAEDGRHRAARAVLAHRLRHAFKIGKDTPLDSETIVPFLDDPSRRPDIEEALRLAIRAGTR